MLIYMVNQGNLTEQKNPIFSTGDAYIIDDNSKIWIWLGKNCSVDEKGIAAVEARRMDNNRGGAAKIITIDQGNELVEFLSLMNGMRIVDKNLAKTMLKDVSTGSYADHADHVNVLYRISSEEFEGIDAMKFEQVPFEKSSLDSEDAFIADLGSHIWVWQGSNCNVKEKVKAGSFARSFDADRAGSQEIEIFEEGEDTEFLGIFGGALPQADRVGVELRAESPISKEENFVDLSKPSIPPPAIKSVAQMENEMEPEPEPIAKPEPISKPEPIPEPEPIAKPEPESPSQTPAATLTGDILVQRGGGRLTCPKCGNNNKNMIREVEDRTRIINDYPIIYGKKFICGTCGVEFRTES